MEEQPAGRAGTTPLQQSAVPVLAKSAILAAYIQPTVAGRPVPDWVYRGMMFVLYLLPFLWNTLSPTIFNNNARLHFDGCRYPFFDFVDFTLEDCIRCNGNRTYVIGNSANTDAGVQQFTHTVLLSFLVLIFVARIESIRRLARRLFAHGVLLRGGGRDSRLVFLLLLAAVQIGYVAYETIKSRKQVLASSIIYASYCPVAPGPASYVELQPTYDPSNPAAAGNGTFVHLLRTLAVNSLPVLIALYSLYQRGKFPLGSVDVVQLLKDGDRRDEVGRHVRFTAELKVLSKAVYAKHPDPKPCGVRCGKRLSYLVPPYAGYLGDTWGPTPGELRTVLQRLCRIKVGKVPAIAPLGRKAARLLAEAEAKRTAGAGFADTDPEEKDVDA